MRRVNKGMSKGYGEVILVAGVQDALETGNSIAKMCVIFKRRSNTVAEGEMSPKRWCRAVNGGFCH